MVWKIPGFLRIALFKFYSKCLWHGPRPARCYRNKRAVVNQFEDSERLYFIGFSDWIETDGRIRSAFVPIPDMSVNRSGLSGRFWFVLLPEPEYPEDDFALTKRRLCKGIARIRACELPNHFVEQDKTYSLRVEHDPLDHNYHHSEIRVLQDGVWIRGKDLSTEVKKHYRSKISDHARVILKPEVSTGK